jgi:hypothetical protein
MTQVTAGATVPARIAHLGIPGLAPFVAVGLFFAGMGAAWGAYRLVTEPARGRHRAAGIGLGVVAFGCFGVATALPLIVHATPTLVRPSTTGRLEFLSPREGQVLRGDPATVEVRLRLRGGRIVPISSLHLIPNAGHIHLYLDGSLRSMTGLQSTFTARPGPHRLQAEFVAVDHGPFRPRVLAAVSFRVRA